MNREAVSSRAWGSPYTRVPGAALRTGAAGRRAEHTRHQPLPPGGTSTEAPPSPYCPWSSTRRKTSPTERWWDLSIGRPHWNLRNLLCQSIHSTVFRCLQPHPWFALGPSHYQRVQLQRADFFTSKTFTASLKSSVTKSTHSQWAVSFVSQCISFYSFDL